MELKGGIRSERLEGRDTLHEQTRPVALSRIVSPPRTLYVYPLPSPPTTTEGRFSAAEAGTQGRRVGPEVPPRSDVGLRCTTGLETGFTTPKTGPIQWRDLLLLLFRGGNVPKTPLHSCHNRRVPTYCGPRRPAFFRVLRDDPGPLPAPGPSGLVLRRRGTVVRGRKSGVLDGPVLIN